jgi:putative oxidoreductase
MRMNSPLSEATWAFSRFVFGVSLALFHGYGKVFEGKVEGLTNTVAGLGFPVPSFFAWAASIAEFFGGILVALGFLTRPAAAMCATTMAVALYRHRLDPPAKMEMAALYLAMMLLIVVVGGGRFSLDRVLKLRNPLQRKPLL